jgi:hypothetical protein
MATVVKTASTVRAIEAFMCDDAMTLSIRETTEERYDDCLRRFYARR